MAVSLLKDYRKAGKTPPPGGSSGWGGGGGRPGSSRQAAFLGMLVVFAAVAVFFGALSVAFLVRRASSQDWAGVRLPRVLWWNTGVLLVSSVLLELARRALRSARRLRFNLYWTAGTALGALFLAGQYLAWRLLQNGGISLGTNPGTSFFYVLTVAHASHLLGGVIALLYVDIQALRFRLGPGKRTAADVSVFYWHFMGALWVYVFALLVLLG